MQVALWGRRQGLERARHSLQDPGIDIGHITGGLHKSQHDWRVPIRRWQGFEIFLQSLQVFGTRSTGHFTPGLSEEEVEKSVDHRLLFYIIYK